MLRRISDGSIQRSIQGSHSSGKTSRDEDKGKEPAQKVVLVPFIKLVRNVEGVVERIYLLYGFYLSLLVSLC